MSEIWISYDYNKGRFFVGFFLSQITHFIGEIIGLVD